MHSVCVNGQDIFAVYETVKEAVERARKGEGPTFIEAKTYRYYGHFEGDAMSYRDKEEVESYREKDCIEFFRKYVIDNSLLEKEQLTEIDKKVSEIIEQAVRFAQESPDPDPKEL